MIFFVFAGTTEGREIAQALSEAGFECTVSVATDCGAAFLPKGRNLTVLRGRMSHAEMSEHLERRDYDYVIDATHPFAVEASAQIKKACLTAGKSYIRVSRSTERSSFDSSAYENILFFDSAEEAGEWLDGQDGGIFVTTGSKELPVLAGKITDRERIFARVLPTAESISICSECGISPKRIIAMCGAFSERANEVQFAESGARILLTKESGASGGYPEKLMAAAKLGMKVAVIRNPERSMDCSSVLSVDGLLRKIQEETGIPLAREKRLSLVSLGTGSGRLFTQEMMSIIESADIIFGAERVLRAVSAIKPAGVHTESLYKSSEIAEFLRTHTDYKRPAVVFSGDAGFYSGAAQFLKDGGGHFDGWNVRVASGISSPVYFASKLQKSWNEWKFLSLHGAKCNLIEQIRKNPACFFILSGAEDARNVGKRLDDAISGGVLGEITCFFGSNLSYSDEKCARITPAELACIEDCGEYPLYVLLVENMEAVAESATPILCDDAFVRQSGVPMTKKEIRQLSVCALSLSSRSVLYDIGCGTGSVTVEAARIATDGVVYAVDRDKDAVALTKKNADAFFLDNVVCVEGDAADVLGRADIIPPTHIFIGGSGGSLSEICRLALRKNPRVRVVANFVTIEGLCEMQSLLKSLSDEGFLIRDVEIKQVSVSKAERAGGFHLMKALNPVYIVSFSGA